jgi:hypothetical protein
MSLAKTSANVDIIADDLLQQHLLKTALMHFGFKIILITNPSKMKDKSGLDLMAPQWTKLC